MTMEKTKFEVVDTPIMMRNYKSKWTADTVELMAMMLKISNGKSIRRGFNSLREARGFTASLHNFIKTRKLKDVYFVSCRTTAQDGLFYIYIGKKGE